MTKTLTETQITTARARSKLGLGVHWRRVDAEAHLGYRKGKRSGIWFVRWRNHYDGANYKQAAVGVANDANDKVTEGKLSCCRFDGHRVKLIPPCARTQPG